LPEPTATFIVAVDPSPIAKAAPPAWLLPVLPELPELPLLPLFALLLDVAFPPSPELPLLPLTGALVTLTFTLELPDSVCEALASAFDVVDPPLPLPMEVASAEPPLDCADVAPEFASTVIAAWATPVGANAATPAHDIVATSSRSFGFRLAM
jgi:hypothetical protein